MKRAILAVACVGFLGCASHPKPSAKAPSEQYRLTVTVERVEPPQCPYVQPGTKYIPEAKQFIDFLTDPKDFESWHYLGRNRAPYDWEREIHAAELAAAESPNVQQLQIRVDELKMRYADNITETTIADAQRYNSMVKELIAESNGGGWRGPSTTGK